MGKKLTYIAHPISTTGEFNDSKRLGERVEKADLSYRNYVPAENDSINDKTNDPTPKDIYEQDVSRLKMSDRVVVNYTGGNSEGTVLEVGILSGLKEGKASVRKSLAQNWGEVDNTLHSLMSEDISLYEAKMRMIEVIVGAVDEAIPDKEVLAFTSNQRASKPQSHRGISSAGLNHMVLGALEANGIWFDSEDELVKFIKENE